MGLVVHYSAWGIAGNCTFEDSGITGFGYNLVGKAVTKWVFVNQLAS